MPFIWYYLITINALGLLFMHMDKKRARMDLLRIPEILLLSIAVIGGSIGVSLGMILFRHKTKKPLFLIILPILPALQLLFFILVWYT